jgi:hypothetical protein
MTMTTRNVLLAAVLVVALHAETQTVTGEWSVVATIAPPHGTKGTQQRIELVCAFEEHEDTLTGSCRPPNGPEGVAVSGTTHDRQVTWSFDIAPAEKAQKERATFRGTVGGKQSTIKGSVEFGASRGSFEAKRR